MVISIETTMAHPKRGFVKLEDTVVVTQEGCEGLGDIGRGWYSAPGEPETYVVDTFWSLLNASFARARAFSRSTTQPRLASCASTPRLML